MKSKEDIPDFEGAIVDQIIDICQPFITFKTTTFRVIIRFIRYIRKIVKRDIIALRVYNQVKVFEKDLINLLDYIYTIVAISFDNQTSTNNLLMFAINSK